MIAELNQRANILAPTLTPDGGGGTTATWNTVATVWAKLEPLSGGETFAGQAPRSTVRYRITLRRNAATIVGRRVAIGLRSFRIADVLDDGSPLVSLLCEDLP